MKAICHASLQVYVNSVKISSLQLNTYERAPTSSDSVLSSGLPSDQSRPMFEILRFALT